MKIYYLGPQGTFTHQAAMTFQAAYGLESAELVAVQSVTRVISEVSSAPEGVEAVACVPIENSIQGSVTTSWDTIGMLSTEEQSLLQSGELSVLLGVQTHKIVAACRQPIRQNLLTLEPAQLESIREVYSHPQALAQCRQWLEQHVPNASLYSVESTSLAAEKVKSQQHNEIAAIASIAAASYYHLHVNVANIEDSKHNMTRFALFGKTPFSRTASAAGTRGGCALTSNVTILSVLLTGVSNCPGGLYQALGPFTEAALNLRRIESRPVGTDLGTYVFYLDMDWPEAASTSVWDNVYGALSKLGIKVTVLGLYPEHDALMEE